ncbi:FAD/NAD(P)-binding domain-containing protein [Neurospora crassa]|uniref:Flavin-binding monooxygenase n=1 Tax=Neurospora crassa (strain ATCC 24698 / 74-OR23-1A / CBS 708.71 / DSM 1257 / FGSC 987) TaxID=367110 RepID=Q7SD22_NEUCR|nr:flavin-binding monooxygenase [Neurospora crassa OR74A]EAA34659.3 flavin-binding monooxygenase [Neurospora crassa OR74A]KHE79922.1 FAD/NAD(P)-binding domain-containing protein [Neurospora crassa]|eukprot:XP_963895.3 flavin-binding monooxygenase [Neurospora crassa OR74A]
MATTTNGHMDGSDLKKKFTLKDTVVENLRPLRVVVIGAGYSGIGAAIRIPEKLRNVELVVYEKYEGVGGTWWVNTYPGVACDIPSHSYQFSFAPNPNWSNLYAPGHEIQKYLQDVAEKFGATRFIKLSHKVEECVWDDGQKKWQFKVMNLVTGEVFTDSANVLITARGQLSEPRWPDILGIDQFKGKKMHSGAWDKSYDLRNKKIAVVGNGSSAIQIVPKLQKLEGTTLSCFIRSPTWISSAFGDNTMKDLGLDPKVTECHPMTIEGQAFFKADMESKLSARPDLLAKIIPAFAPGCRRLTPGRGYLEALQQPNVTAIHDPISHITSSGIALATVEGKKQIIDADVIVFATGFQACTSPPFPIIGRRGLTLASRWSQHPDSYLGLAVDGFPNYLMLFGPNTTIGFGSLNRILEAQVDYIVSVIRKLQKEDYASMEPKPERVRDFVAFVDAYFKDTVYLDKCKSWYRSEGGTGNRIVALWPGSTQHAVETLRSPRWEDWMYEGADKSGNGLRWLGNGWSLTQTEGDPSWYLNPEEIEFPWEGKPEENPKYKSKPWSH